MRRLLDVIRDAGFWHDLAVLAMLTAAVLAVMSAGYIVMLAAWSWLG